MYNRSPSDERHANVNACLMFDRSTLVVLIILVTGSLWPGNVTAKDTHEQALLNTLQKHCATCHGQNGEVNGEVDLRDVSTADKLKERPELLRNLVKVIELREMPPEDEPQLSEREHKRLLDELQRLFHESVAAQNHLGHVPIRRMNRFQYNNAVTDLFELNCVVFTLPERMARDHKNYFQPASGQMPDVVTVGCRPLGKSQLIEPRLAGVAAFPQDLRAEHGFDNRGDHLSLSPLLMESFLKLSRSITLSPDFGPKRVGIWSEFFASPNGDGIESLEAAVRDRLRPFLTRAFRRPVELLTLDRYTDLVTRKLTGGTTFTDAMKLAAAAAIASPRFLYLYDEANSDTGVEPLSDLELASRLSFFLWGSVPDQQLIDLAIEEKLNDDGVLSGQVNRMLRDMRLKRFCDGFPAQWLQLDRIVSSVPDPDRFPQFYFAKYRDSMHMVLEPLLLFETILIENRRITQLIDSDFTYRSVLLREAYGETVSAEEKKAKRGNATSTVLYFHRQPITDRRYGGVITNAAVMTMTSGPDRTKPITRGSWFKTAIFNDPPEPPPADVPPLPDEPAVGNEDLTLRERLSLHRERADCRGCHEQIDPLGFALENYNPIGVWRDEYENGRAINVSGELFHSHTFGDVIEFKETILAEKDRFTEALAGHMLSYALARQLDAADSVALRKIAQVVADYGYLIHTLIRQVVLSKPFRNRRNLTREQVSDVAP